MRASSSSAWVLLCAALTAALFVVDLLTGDAVVLVTLYALGPLLAGVRVRAAPTAAVGALALVLGLIGVIVVRTDDTAQDAVRVLTVAIGAGVAVWGAWLRDRRADAEALLDVIFDRVPVGLAYFDRDLRYVRINERMAEINGLPAAAHIGRTTRELLPDLPGEVEADLRRVLETGTALTEVQVSGETPARPGARREWLASYWPVRQRADGEISGIGCVVFEVTERRAAQRELRAQTDRYEALLLALSEAGEGMLVIEHDGRCVYANAAFEQLSGYTMPELTALDSVLALVLPEHRDDARRRAVMRVEQGLVDHEYGLTMRRRDGELVDLEVVGVPLEPETTGSLVLIVRDVTDRRRAELERERLLSRSALMAEASELFDRTLDEAGTLERVARLCVRELADTCIVVLGEGPGAVRRVAAAARDPQVERTLLERQLRDPIDEDPDHAVFEVLRGGEPRIVERDGGEPIAGVGTPAAMIVPLRARGAVTGVLALGFATLEGHDRDDLLALFDDLGRRAALALDSARLYEERAAVARTLQRSLLPAGLPTVPGVEIAARYLAAGEGNEVGGDFYDCFATAEDEWAVVVGDVCGKGAEAAAVTALARYTLRAAAVHDRRPVAMLRELNDAILRHGTDYRFCTAVYAGLVRRPEGIDATVATGGHPLPLVLRADGRVEVAGRNGTLLGVVAEPRIGEETVRLRPGDALVLFTDGVTEAVPLDAAFGPERLAGFLGGCAGQDATGIAAGVERRVLEQQAGRLRDDVAVVVLRVAPGEPAPFVPAREGVAARS